MIERERIVLPEPDSPTMPSARPLASLKLTPSTAFTTPSAVSKWVRRSSTSRRRPDSGRVPVCRWRRERDISVTRWSPGC